MTVYALLYDNLCISLWQYVHIHVAMCVYSCVNMCIFMWQYVYIHVAICVCLYGNICIFIWQYMNIHVAICVYSCGNVYIHVGICFYVTTLRRGRTRPREQLLLQNYKA